MGTGELRTQRNSGPVPLVVSPARVAFGLLCVAGFLVTMAIVVRYVGGWLPDLDRLFNPNLEGGLPAWFSQALHLVAALLCVVIFRHASGHAPS